MVNLMSKQFLQVLRSKNIERQLKWPGSEKIDALFRAVEVGEEAGEVLGAAKKYYRAINGIAGNKKTKEEIRENLEDEVGDVVIALDLLCIQYGIDIETSIRRKFNKTSKSNNINVYIEEN